MVSNALRSSRRAASPQALGAPARVDPYSAPAQCLHLTRDERVRRSRIERRDVADHPRINGFRAISLASTIWLNSPGSSRKLALSDDSEVWKDRRQVCWKRFCPLLTEAGTNTRPPQAAAKPACGRRRPRGPTLQQADLMLDLRSATPEQFPMPVRRQVFRLDRHQCRQFPASHPQRVARHLALVLTVKTLLTRNPRRVVALHTYSQPHFIILSRVRRGIETADFVEDSARHNRGHPDEMCSSS